MANRDVALQAAEKALVGEREKLRNMESEIKGFRKSTKQVVTLLSHCCYTAFTVLLHCCYTIATLLLHCCDTVVTIVTLLPYCCHTA
jgi:hypothetical protein